MPNNLTSNLTLDQLKQNIDALQKGGMSNDGVQSYVNNYQKSGEGYILKGTQPQTTPQTQPTKTDEFFGGLKTFNQTATDVGKGFLKSAGRSIGNLSNLGTELSNLVGPGRFIKKQGTNEPFFQPKPIPEILQSTNTAQAVGGAIETGAELALPFVGGKEKIASGLIKSAQDLYLSALKPSTTLSIAERSQMVKTGLEEGIRLTENGVGKLNATIDTLEGKLTSFIDAAKDKGGKILTTSLRPMIEQAKSVFGNTVNVAESESNIQKIETLYNDFVAKYGDSVDVKKAQVLKTNTYQILRKSFGELGSAVQEGMKGMARGLKEGIIKEAPQVAGVNDRLSKLYQFSDSLEKAVKRIGNQNIISLGGKVLMSGEGITNKILAGVQELFKAGGKSTVSILMNKLGQKLAPEEVSQLTKVLQKLAGPTGVVDINNLIQTLSGQSTNQ
jgi:hypothetical protein